MEKKQYEIKGKVQNETLIVKSTMPWGMDKQAMFVLKHIDYCCLPSCP